MRYNYLFFPKKTYISEFTYFNAYLKKFSLGIKSFYQKTFFLIMHKQNNNISFYFLTAFQKIHQFFSNANCGAILFTSWAPKNNFFRYFYNGLGYKIFVRAGHLFIWLGLTHYTIIPIPHSISIFAKKRRIYIVGYPKIIFNEFIFKIRSTRKIDLYKGKGLLEVKSYKGFLRMKSGKKKQY